MAVLSRRGGGVSWHVARGGGASPMIVTSRRLRPLRPQRRHLRHPDRGGGGSMIVPILLLMIGMFQSSTEQSMPFHGYFVAAQPPLAGTMCPSWVVAALRGTVSPEGELLPFMSIFSPGNHGGRRSYPCIVSVRADGLCGRRSSSREWPSHANGYLSPHPGAPPREHPARHPSPNLGEGSRCGHGRVSTTTLTPYHLSPSEERGHRRRKASGCRYS